MNTQAKRRPYAPPKRDPYHRVRTFLAEAG